MAHPIRRLLVALLWTACAVWPTAADAHDVSSWGGLFKTRDGGATWFQASAGKVMGSALAVAVDPTDPSHLLLGTDSGLLGSSNGGRDWDLVASDPLVGPVLAVAFDADGRSILAAGVSAVVQSNDGLHWRAMAAPVGVSPARALVAGAPAGAFYLAGWQGLFRTDDSGTTWTEVGAGLPEKTVTQLLASPSEAGTLVAVAAGEVWLSRDGGQRWEVRRSGLPSSRVQAVALDPRRSTSLWAAGNNQLFRSDDGGASWQSFGMPLVDAETEIRAIAVDLKDDRGRIVLSTHRGLYATHDGANTWDLLSDNLPAHIEAGPLVGDRREPSTLYAGFSVVPYDEAWRNAASRSSALARLGGRELAGGAAFLILIGLGSGLALRWLAHRTRVNLASEPAL